MSLGDGERLVRVFTDALEVVDGRSLLGGVPFSGVGVEQDASGRCSLLRYTDGLVSGPFVEPLLNGDQSLLVFDDESDDFFSEDALGVVRFEGEPFTGFAVYRQWDDDRFVRSLMGYEAGHITNELVDWYTDGQLAFYRWTGSRTHVGRLGQTFGWHPDGSPKQSSLRVDLDGSGPRARTAVEFDELGRLTTVSIAPWGPVFERIGEARVRELAEVPVFLSLEELSEFRFGQKLWLNPENCFDSDWDSWLAGDRLADVEDLTCYVSAEQLPRVLALPRLRRLVFERPSPEIRALLEAWQAAAPGRELELPDMGDETASTGRRSRRRGGRFRRR